MFKPISIDIIMPTLENTFRTPLFIGSQIVDNAELVSHEDNTELVYIGSDRVESRAGYENSYRPLEPGERLLIDRATDLSWWNMSSVGGERLTGIALFSTTIVDRELVKPWSLRLVFPTLVNTFSVPISMGTTIVESALITADFDNVAPVRIGDNMVDIRTGFEKGGKALNPGESYRIGDKTDLQWWHWAANPEDVITIGAMIL